MNNKTFDIIELVADNRKYYPNKMEKASWMPDNWVPQSEMNIPLGKSRYGGCVIDFPKGIELPKDMWFAGQLDLKEVSKYDKTNLLPKTGQLLFFANIGKQIGKVIYQNVENNQLDRMIVEHEDEFFSGILINGFKSSQEKLSDYYTVPQEDVLQCCECSKNVLKCSCEYEDKKEHIESLGLNEDGKWWCGVSDNSKIFGLYNHCQYDQDEIMGVINTQIVLLQIGENGFNDDGVFNILIKEKDLKNKNFDNCILEYAQT